MVSQMKRTFVRALLAEGHTFGSAGALLFLAVWSSGLAGCSQSSSGSASGADASPISEAEAGSTPVADGGPPPIGDPVASCNGCPLCGGVLASATTGVSYCTEDCTTSATCPTGTACLTDPMSNQLSKQCLKTCAVDSDCSGVFVCRSDIEDAGSICWSPFPPRAGGPDASSVVADSAAEDGAAALDAGVGSDAGDAATVTASDASADAGDAKPSDASDSGSSPD
jgi:hypothetical protein